MCNCVCPSQSKLYGDENEYPNWNGNKDEKGQLTEIEVNLAVETSLSSIKGTSPRWGNDNWWKFSCIIAYNHIGASLVILKVFFIMMKERVAWLKIPPLMTSHSSYLELIYMTPLIVRQLYCHSDAAKDERR